MKKKSKPDEIDCPACKGTVDLAPASAVPLEARFTVGAVVQPVSVADALSLRLAVSSGQRNVDYARRHGAAS